MAFYQTSLSRPTSPRKSVLVIGATGRTGLACIRQLDQIVGINTPSIHAFCRDQSRLSSADRSICETVYEGDARSPVDLERAIYTSEATHIVIAIGNGDSTSKSTLRTTSAKALVNVLQSKPHYATIRVIVVSSTGASASKIKVGLGLGKIKERQLRHVLNDHTGQEDAFAVIRYQATIVRPTSLTDGSPRGSLIEFGDKDKAPSIRTDRADLALWVTNEILSGRHQGSAVNITGSKSPNNQ